MKPHEAEKLLGGYAAGILTEAEKSVLFSAALAHQELFDALADEEALRELLVDPAIRSHLLSLLGETRAKRPIPLWRRPVTLGLAAGLLAMVTTSVVLWQRELPAPSTPAIPGARTESQSPSPASAAPETAAPQEKAKRVAADSRVNRMEKPAPTVPAPLAEPPPVPSQLMKADVAPARAAEAKKRAADAPQASAVAEVVAAAATSDKAEVATSANDSKERLEELPAARALAGNASLAPGVAGGAVGATRAKGMGVPVPTWTMERLENGDLRLMITWATGKHLYLLKRTPTDTVSLAPLASIIDSTGTTRSTFEFPLDAKDHLDIYLLHHPEANPKALPAMGAVDGFRQRLH